MIVMGLWQHTGAVRHRRADTGAKQPNVSGHLKLLREAGLVTADSQGRYTYYRLVPDVLEATAAQFANLAARARANAHRAPAAA